MTGYAYQNWLRSHNQCPVVDPTGLYLCGRELPCPTHKESDEEE